MTNTAKREIVAGPSCEELFLALRLTHEGRMVTFTLKPSHITGRTLAEGREFVPKNLKLDVRVAGLEFAGNEGNTWLLKLFDATAVLGSTHLVGYLNTTNRQGWLSPEND